MSEKILYFIGAGASRAAWNRMPLMTDFLQLGFEYAQAAKADPDDAWPYWKMMGFHEAIGDGIWDPSLERQTGPANIAAELFGPSLQASFGQLGHAVLGASTPGAKKEAIGRYLERLEHAPPPGYSPSPRMLSRKRTSVERLLSRAEEYALATDDDRPFLATKDFIIWLLGKIEQEMPANGGPTAFDHLCAAIRSQNYGQITRFVSFNYDVLLERALWRTNPPKQERHSGSLTWNPHENFGVGFERYFRLEDVTAGRPIKPTPFKSIAKGQVNVLKPHGSMYWFLERNGERWLAPILDDTDTSLTALPPPGDAFLSLARRHLSGPADSLEPILVPPSPTKAIAGELFWRIWQEIDRELQECAAVVVIGWNMPATDVDVQARITAAISKRSHPIGRLLVCDVRQSEIFYHRFVATFRPHVRLEPWKQGFNERFVKDRLIPELMPKRR